MFEEGTTSFAINKKKGKAVPRRVMSLKKRGEKGPSKIICIGSKKGVAKRQKPRSQKGGGRKTPQTKRGRVPPLPIPKTTFTYFGGKENEIDIR